MYCLRIISLELLHQEDLIDFVIVQPKSKGKIYLIFNLQNYLNNIHKFNLNKITLD